LKKFLSITMTLLFLAGGTAWASRESSDDTGSPSKHHSGKKHSKKKKRKGKKKKGSKGGDKSEAKMETEIGNSDVTLDLKDDK
jgi:hypothetical protein